MEKLYLVACVYSLLMFSFVVNVVQIGLRPLDWIGLKGVRQSITGFYCRGLAACFIFWLEYASGTKITITGDALPPNERVLLICNHVNVEWLHILSLAYHCATADAPKGEKR
jgi:lysocardiolipin and lysophospholipid acyltransferase